MGALFPRWTNTLARVMAVGVLATPAVAIAALMLYVRSPFVTGQFVEVAQPVQFDHRHHSWDEGIDCRYCHTSAEEAASAGIPSTEVCMGCHAQVWNQSPKLAPVREAWFSGKPIEWNRVHDLPDFVYFNHAAHTRKGVGCVSCHGRVDTMPFVMQVAPLTMSWCLECHREPTPHLRPLDKVFSMTWEPVDPVEVGRQVAALLDVQPRQSCTTCHR